MVPNEATGPSGTSRRRVLAGSAAVGAGSVAGCLDEGGSETPTAPQQAADTGPENIQAAADGHVVPVGEGLGPSAAIDPTETETPVQDAVDAIKATGQQGYGAVLLPPQPVDEAEAITGIKRINIIGWHYYKSTIRFPNGTDGLLLQGGNDAYSGIYHLQLQGAGTDAGSAIHFVKGHLEGFHMDEVYLKNWADPNGAVIWSETKFYACNWGRLRIKGCDGTLCHFETIGPANRLENATLSSGDNTDAIIKGRWRGEIGCLNIGGGNDTAGGGPLLDFRTGTTGRIGWINFEYGTKDFQPRDALIRFRGGALGLMIGHVEVKGHTEAKHVIKSQGLGGWEVRHVIVRNDRVSGSILHVAKDPKSPIVYHGVSDDVRIASGAGRLSGQVSCLGDLTVVQ